MNQKTDATTPEPLPSTETPGERAPTKRFRIEKIEERIAPGGHYNPQSRWVGDGASKDGGSVLSTSGSY